MKEMFAYSTLIKNRNSAGYPMKVKIVMIFLLCFI